MIAHRRRALAIFALIVGAACTPKGEPGSCYRDKDNACVEYGATTAVGGKRLCAGYKWLPGAGSCPTADRVGACARQGGASIEILYAGPPNRFTKDAAKATCERTGGAFTP